MFRDVTDRSRGPSPRSRRFGAERRARETSIPSGKSKLVVEHGSSSPVKCLTFKSALSCRLATVSPIPVCCVHGALFVQLSAARVKPVDFSSFHNLDSPTSSFGFPAGLAVFVDVMFVFNEFVFHLLLQVGALRAQAR